MSAKQLIEAAMDALQTFELAKASAKTAAQALQQAQADLDSANKALHDFLVQNGPRLYVDETEDPPVYTIYSACEPDTYTATVIEVAA